MKNFLIHSLKIFLLLGLCKTVQILANQEPCPEPSSSVTINKHEYRYQGITKCSKFLLPRSKTQKPPVVSMDEAREICSQKNKLQLPAIHSMEELWHIVDDWIYEEYFTNSSDPDVYIHIAGIEDMNSLLEAEAQKKIDFPFQFFNLKNGTYFIEGKNCLLLKCNWTSVVFEQVACGSTSPSVVPLCQCLEVTENHLPRVSPDLPAFVRIGENSQGVFYGSTKQKQWLEANTHCLEAGMSPLDLKREDENIDVLEIMEILRGHSIAKGPNHWMQAVWTSGTFTGGFGKENGFTFVPSKKTWGYWENAEMFGSVKINHWNWADDGLVKRPNVETCMAIVDPCLNLVRPIACKIPNYYVCVQKKSEDKNSTLNSLPYNEPGKLDPLTNARLGIDMFIHENTLTTSSCPSTWLDKSRTLYASITDIESRRSEDFLNKELMASSGDHHECRMMNGNICECHRRFYCRYNSGNNRCEQKRSFCQRELSHKPNDCRRPFSYYLVGGSVCLNYLQTPSAFDAHCSITETIMAVNLNGKDFHVDGVKFQEGKNSDYSDSSNITEKMIDWGNNQCNGGVWNNPDDKIIYKSFLKGKPKIPDSCIRFPIPLKQNQFEKRRYELSLMTPSLFSILDTFGYQQQFWPFTVKLNGNRNAGD